MPIYLDHNATTPPDPKVVTAMLPFLGEHFGNPSSVHRHGQTAKRGVDRARRQVAELIGAIPSDIIFTSGGTESNTLAIAGALGHRPLGHVITCAAEHSSVLETCNALAVDRVTVLAVDGHGRVDPHHVINALTPETKLISLMLANNEVGTILPITDIVRTVRQLPQGQSILFHTDAVQAVGKIPVDVNALDVDLLSISGHKLYGPQGIGALFVRRGIALHPIQRGGGQEGGRRSGTHNVAGIVGLGEACALARRRLASDYRHIASLRDRLESHLIDRLPDVRINGSRESRLPNTLNLSIFGVRGDSLLINLDLEGISAAQGSACSTGKVTSSHVLRAMGLSEQEASSAIRFSLGRSNTTVEIDHTVDIICRSVERLRTLGSINHTLPEVHSHG